LKPDRPEELSGKPPVRDPSLSAGTNARLRLGATPWTCPPADVLEIFRIEPVATEAAPVGAVASAILAKLGAGALTADELMR
jgi:hypothetical protein